MFLFLIFFYYVSYSSLPLMFHSFNIVLLRQLLIVTTYVVFVIILLLRQLLIVTTYVSFSIFSSYVSYP